MNIPDSLNKTVFYDAKGNRRRILGSLWAVLSIAATVLLAIFIISIFINPFLPQIRLKPTVVSAQDNANADSPKPEIADREISTKQLIKQVKAEKANRLAEKQKKAETAKMILANQTNPLPDAVNTGRPLAVGFYVNWDDSSYASLKNNINELDWMVPEWIRLSDDAENPLILDVDQKVLDLVHSEKPSMPVLPLVQNYKNEKWDPAMLAKAVATEESRQKLINALLETIAKNNFGGVTVDLEEVPATSQKNLFEFVRELHDEFQNRGLIVAQAVPFDNPDWNYRAYADVTDYLMLMAYDQHWSEGAPGAIAGQDWFDTTLKKRMSELSPAKTIVCFGNYGYNWTNGAKEAEDVTFQEAVLAAKESLDSAREIKFDSTSKNPHFSYVEDDGKTHNVWFLDATTAYNEIKSSSQYQPAGYALWRLGSEDPSLWNIFGTSKTTPSTDGLQSIKYGYDVDFEGTGEILQVIAEPQDGVRDLKTDEQGFIANEIYESVPSSYVIQRTGDHPGMIALTFDDGPDPVWTPKILDILKQENVKATFFVIGENGQTSPDLIKRIVAEGHDIGNHSFTHPNLGEVPQQVTDLELNATQRLIESLTGRSTRLFRAPYFGDAEPRTPDEVEPTVQAQKLGYISVGLHLDPDDWKLNNDDGTRRTADDLVKQTLDAAAVTTAEERGQIVLLHDGGGDRMATIEALPKIIHELKNKGCKFVTTSELAGLSRDEAMPVVSSDKAFLTSADSVFFYLVSLGGWLIKWTFIIGIALGLGRVTIIGSLALAQYLRSRKREVEHFGEEFQPLVSVVVPAFNEAKVICRTIESLLASDYSNIEIIVVDDGSSDNTSEIVRENFGGNKKVSLYTKENAGKSEALNFGWRRAKGEIIVALDADTLFTSKTIAALAHRFADSDLGAIAGNAKVGNRINVLTKWQALEYITSQNFDRRAFSSLNCIMVVPGAVGAWRRSVLEKTDGFSSDTLAEDQDLTIQVRKLGYKIGYEEEAVGYTEAPDTFRGFAKQRFRWSYGTLQCMWKHKNALFNHRYEMLGFAAMPNVWIFQILFPLISPLMDLMFVWTLISALIGYLEHQKEYTHTPTNLNAVLFFYALFTAIDLLGAYLAFCLEKGERKRLLWWLLLQRFGYRQVMYWVMGKSVVKALSGAIVGWGKVERKATVEAITS